MSLIPLPFSNANKNFNKNGFVCCTGCNVVGFLKFLKRERKEDALEDLDMPPAPPPLEGFEEGSLPELPGFPEEDISAKDMEMPEPKFEFPEKEGLPELNEPFPDFKFPEMEETPVQIAPVRAPPVTEPQAQPMPEEEPAAEMPEPEAMPKIGGRLFAHARDFARERPAARTIYVKVDRFKAILGSISMVRSDLRKSEGALMKLESIKNSKDRTFDKFKASLEDLQKKLIFVDKTLFKGD